jgi:hypothetical protein
MVKCLILHKLNTPFCISTGEGGKFAPIKEKLLA